MDEVVKKIAALGLPAVILAIVITMTGLSGAAAITAALAFLGGPWGMLGGLAALGIAGLVADGLASMGLDELLMAVYKQRAQSESPTRLGKEINDLPISGDLKRKLKEAINCN